MKKIINAINNFLHPNKKSSKIREDVRYSVKKYHKTYKLLDEYDKKPIQDPEVLAESGRLRPYIRGFQRITGI